MFVLFVGLERPSQRQGHAGPVSYLRPSFFYFLLYLFFWQQVRVGGRNRNKNKIHLDHFPIELKSKETHVSFDFNSIGK